MIGRSPKFPGLSALRIQRVAPLWAASIAFLASLSQPSLADTVRMRGGREVNGIILQDQCTDEHVVIRTTTGPLKINRAKIEKVEIREEASGEEKQGDLAADQSDFERALRLYLRAYSSEPDNKNLETKIGAMKDEIKKRDDRKFGLQFEKIEKALTLGKYEDAAALGRELAEKVGEESVRQRCMEKIAQAYIAQARDFRNTVSYPQAEQAYKKAIEAYPGGAVAELELGELVERYPTRRAEAYEFYKQGIDLGIKDPTLIDKDALLLYRFNAAKLLLDQERYRDAALAFWEVVKADAKEKHAKALEYIVRAYSAVEKELFEENEENRKAIEVIEGVAAKRPLEDDSPHLLGRIYYSRKDYEKAKTYLDQAIKNMGTAANQTDAAEAHYMLADSLRKTGQDREAIEHYRKTLSVYPNRYEAICDLGDTHFDLAEYESALEQYGKAVGLDQENYRAYYGAGKTLRRVEKYSEAAVMYEQLVKIKDDEPQFHFELGLTYTALNRFEDARKTYTKVLDLLKGADESSQAIRDMLADTYMNLGFSNYALKRFNEAIEQFDKAVGFRAKFAKALEGKGKSQLALNDVTQAEKTFKECLALEPENPEYHLNLGTLTQTYKKDLKTALGYYMAYFEKGGKDPQVRQWIIECGGTPP